MLFGVTRRFLGLSGKLGLKAAFKEKLGRVF